MFNYLLKIYFCYLLKIYFCYLLKIYFCYLLKIYFCYLFFKKIKIEVFFDILYKEKTKWKLMKTQNTTVLKKL